MQFVVRLVEADVLLVCLVENGRISNVARSNNHRNDCATRVEAFPIWIIDKFQSWEAALAALVAVPGRCTTNKSIGEPPGWDWRGSKMAAFKYLICRPKKQVFCLYLRRILDNKSLWMSPKSTFLVFKKCCTSCPNWGEGGEVIWTKSKRRATFFFVKPSLMDTNHYANLPILKFFIISEMCPPRKRNYHG